MAYNQLDIYHRAFRAYKNELDAYLKENKLHKAICRTPMSKEYLEATRFRCSVRLDWIEAIEKSLPFIEKAQRIVYGNDSTTRITEYSLYTLGDE